jgi:hypothetical protein
MPSDTRPPPRTDIPAPTPPTADVDWAKSTDRIRQWACHFEGTDPAAFLERVEELRDAYGYTGPQLFRGLPELLRGEAIMWYRNHRASWDTWEDFAEAFRSYYMPRRYFARLRREIRNRLQGPTEPYRRFAAELQTLMRRAGGYTADDQIEWLTENMQPRYKIYIRRETIRSATDLLHEAEEVEDVEEQCRSRGTGPPSPKPSAPDTAGEPDRPSTDPTDLARADPTGTPRAERERHRGQRHRSPTAIGTIVFTPRPYLRTAVHGQAITALLDSGAEISFINPETAQRLQEHGFRPHAAQGHIYVADGTESTTGEAMTLPVELPDRTIEHEFRILPGLDDQMLIGVDLLARARIAVPPTPIRREGEQARKAAPRTCATTRPTCRPEPIAQTRRTIATTPPAPQAADPGAATRRRRRRRRHGGEKPSPPSDLPSKPHMPLDSGICQRGGWCNEAPKTALRTDEQSPTGARALDRPRYNDAFALPPAPRETGAASEPYARSRVAGMPAADRSRRLPEHPRHLEIRVYKAAAPERRRSLSRSDPPLQETPPRSHGIKKTWFPPRALGNDRPRSRTRCSVGSSDLGSAKGSWRPAFPSRRPDTGASPHKRGCGAPRLRQEVLAWGGAIYRSDRGINRHASRLANPSTDPYAQFYFAVPQYLGP